MDQAQKPLHYLAYLMHPVHKGKKLTTEQSEIVCNWANIKIPSFLQLITTFEERPFAEPYFKAADET